MKKSDIISAVASKTGMTKANAEAAINAYQDLIIETLAAGNEFQVIGFGSFSVKETKERSGRNPRTGEAMTIPASKRPTFKAGKVFKDAIQ